jgi:hypothetical protein
MKKQAVIVLTLFALIIGTVALVGVVYADAPDVVTIDKAKAKKAPVVFPHGEHAKDIDCVTCHHTAKGKDDAGSCFECHGKDPNAPDPSVSSAKENPFHVLCRSCHKEQGKGPTKCHDCHKK